MQSPPAPHGRSLWRELADGSAGWVVRAIVTVALGAVLSGACLIGAYLLAAMFPQLFDRGYRYGWSYPSRGGRAVYPDDALVAWLFVIAGLAWLGAIAWIWSRLLKKHRALWYAAIATIIISGVTVAADVIAEDWIGGDDELVLTGIALLGGAAVLVLWVEVWRRYGRGRPVTNAQDGLPDVRCPTCGYRMVGLYESRCPECGTAYTLEDLLGRQEFVTARAGETSAPRAAAAPPALPPSEHADRLPPVPTS
jgi:hypothetical protein